MREREREKSDSGREREREREREENWDGTIALLQNILQLAMQIKHVFCAFMIKYLNICNIEVRMWMLKGSVLP